MPINLAAGRAALPLSDILIPSGDFSAADPAAVEFPTLGANSLTVVTDVTAQSGANNALTVNIEGFDPASQKWVVLSSPVYDAGAAKTYPAVIDPDGPAMVKRVAIGNPAAGANWSTSVPTLEAWELVAVNFQLVASGVAASRLVGLQIRGNNAAEVATVVSTTAVAASQTVLFSFMNGYSGQPTSMLVSGTTFRQNLGVPVVGKILPSGLTIASINGALDAGDQFSAISVTVSQQLRELYPRMRVRPVRSGTTTTLTYSIGATLSF